MSDNDIAIRVENVSKTFKLPHEKNNSIKGAVVNFYRRKRTFELQKALQNISFEVKKGEFFGIVGRNGSGKSTMLKLLAGIYTPSKGTVTVNGKLTPFIELGVGFNPELTGRENVFLNGALLGFNRREMNAMYHDIVEFAELERFMDQKLKNYSSGMQVRLAFSIAIRAQSDILLIDEVLAVGDAVFQTKCYEYFAQLKKLGKTVIFVSHDSGALQRFCDRGILIEKGKIVLNDTIKKVIDRYKDDLITESVESSGSKSDNKKTRLASLERITIQSANRGGAIQFGDDLLVKIKLKVNDKKVINNLNIAVGMYDGLYEAHGAYAFGASTQIDNFVIGKDTTEAVLRLVNPPLKNGKYYVYVSLFGELEDVPYDYVSEAATFNVTGGPELTSRGAIITDYNWSVR